MGPRGLDRPVRIQRGRQKVPLLLQLRPSIGLSPRRPPCRSRHRSSTVEPREPAPMTIRAVTLPGLARHDDLVVLNPITSGVSTTLRPGATAALPRRAVPPANVRDRGCSA